MAQDCTVSDSLLLCEYQRPFVAPYTVQIAISRYNLERIFTKPVFSDSSRYAGSESPLISINGSTWPRIWDETVFSGAYLRLFSFKCLFRTPCYALVLKHRLSSSMASYGPRLGAKRVLDALLGRIFASDAGFRFRWWCPRGSAWFRMVPRGSTRFRVRSRGVRVVSRGSAWSHEVPRCTMKSIPSKSIQIPSYLIKVHPNPVQSIQIRSDPSKSFQFHQNRSKYVKTN